MLEESTSFSNLLRFLGGDVIKRHWASFPFAFAQSNFSEGAPRFIYLEPPACAHINGMVTFSECASLNPVVGRGQSKVRVSTSTPTQMGYWGTSIIDCIFSKLRLMFTQSLIDLATPTVCVARWKKLSCSAQSTFQGNCVTRCDLLLSYITCSGQI